MNKITWIEMSSEQREAYRELSKIVAGSKEFVYNVASSQGGKTRYYDEEDILTMFVKGGELGFGPMQSLSSLYNERGKLTLHAEAMLALAWGTGQMTHFSIEKLDADGCVIKIGRNGMDPIEVSFTQQDAKDAGLWGKSGNWTIRTVLMLRHRCISKAVRMLFADATQGLYMTGELSEGEFYEEGGEVDRIYADEVRKATAEKKERKAATPVTPVVQPEKSREEIENVHDKLSFDAKKELVEEVETKVVSKLSEAIKQAAETVGDKVEIAPAAPAVDEQALREELKVMVKNAKDLYPAKEAMEALSNSGLDWKEGWSPETHPKFIVCIAHYTAYRQLIKLNEDLYTPDQAAAYVKKAVGVDNWTLENHESIMKALDSFAIEQKLKIAAMKAPTNGAKPRTEPISEEDFNLDDMYEDDEDAEPVGFSSKK